MTQKERTNRSVLGTFLSYAIPSVVAMLVTSLYIVIEGIILGRGAGAHALAAVNISFPATILINVFLIGVSVGGANLMSIRLGEEKPEAANNIFMQSMVIMIAVALLFILLGNVFLWPFCMLLGADSALLPDVMTYVRFFLISSLPFVLTIGLNTFIRNDGDPRLSMFSSVTSTIATAVIVYVFIFILKWGIAGAAIAGGLGNVFSLFVLSSHFIRKKGILRIAKPRFNKADLKKIFGLGFPSMMTELAVAFSSFCFNIAIMGRIGEIGISAYSIATYINSFIILILMGLSQGIQPIVSFHYGAKEMKTVTQTYRIALISALIMSAATILVIFCFGEGIVKVFNSESEQLVDLAKTVLMFACLAYIPTGINMVNITYYQSVENPKLSTLISILRGFIFVQLGLFTLPLIFGNTGLWTAALFGETLTLIATLLVRKRMSRNELSK